MCLDVFCEVQRTDFLPRMSAFRINSFIHFIHPPPQHSHLIRVNGKIIHTSLSLSLPPEVVKLFFLSFIH